MNLRTFRESVPFADGHSYDLVVAASGYESRARYFAETYSDQLSRSTNKIVLGFAEHASACARSENDRAFAALGYRALTCSGGAHHEVLEILRGLFTDLCVHAPVRILVDISSMTRSWYGAVIRALLDLHAKGSVAVTFAYSGADYIPPPPEYPANRVVGPVAGFTGNTLPDKPTALVIGLGYDKGRAIGLKDHLDPQLTVLFYADPAVDRRYVDQVRQINAQLIGEVGDGRLFTYPFDDCGIAFRTLESVCAGLSCDWRVVLCSLGPKVFGLYSFLVAALIPDVSIWRVSADSHEIPIDRRANGTTSVFTTTWA